MWLKQSTAVTVKMGPFVDDADGKTAETALTISQADIRISKNGGDIAQSNNAAGATHDELGYYDVPLNATDTATVGTLRVLVSETGALPVWQDFMVLPDNVWDSLFGADKLKVHVDEFTTGVITASALAAGAINAASIAADAITAAKLAADVTTELQSGLATTAHVQEVEDKVDIVDTNVDTVLADTNDIQTRIPAALTGGGNMKADVLAVSGDTVAADTLELMAEAMDQATGQIDSGTFAAGAINAAAIAADAIGASELAADAVAEIADQVWDEALAGHLAAGSTGEALNAAGAAGDPWTTQLPGAYGAGSAGKIIGDNINAPIATVDTVVDAIKAKTDNLPADPADASDLAALIDALPTAAEVATSVWAAGTRTLTSFGTLVQDIWDKATSALTVAGSIGKLLVDNINATISSRLATAGYTAPPTVGQVADQVWDEALAGHLAAGSTGEALNAAGAAGDPWTTQLPGAYGAGSAGKIVGDNINAPIATVDTVVDAIKAKTDNLPSDPADASVVAGLISAVETKVDTVDTVVDAVKAKTDNLPASPAAVGSAMTLAAGQAVQLNAQGKVDVNAEVLDVLNVDTFAEPGQGAPAATASLVTKLGFVYKAWRNRKTQSATQTKLYGDDATTVDQKAAVSEVASVVESGEVGTGP